MKNIFAYTPNTHPYPEFVSINQQDNGEITLTVREAAKPGEFSDKDCGLTVMVKLPLEQIEEMATSLRISANNLKIIGTA